MRPVIKVSGIDQCVSFGDLIATNVSQTIEREADQGAKEIQKRERSLLKEFESYKSAPGRRLKEFRLEVLRAGFKTAWAGKDYKTIIGIAQKIPDEALQEDEKLLLWYDQALTRMEADA